MTTAPNALTDSIKHERMPVLLSEEQDFETWLSGTSSEAFALARSYTGLNSESAFSPNPNVFRPKCVDQLR